MKRIDRHEIRAGARPSDELDLSMVVRVRKPVQFREPTGDELAQLNRGFMLIFLLLIALCLAGVVFFYLLVALASL